MRKATTPTKKYTPKIQKNIFMRYILALLCGAALTLAFAPFSIWIIAIVSIGIFNLLLMDTDRVRSFSLAFSFGIGLFATGTSWVYVSIHDYGNAAMPLAAGLTALFVIGIAFIFALPFIFYGLLDNQNTSIRLFAFPAIWILGEWFRSWFLTGFPWLLLGYSSLDTWLEGWAPIAGVYSLSGGMALSGVVLSICLTQRLSNATIGGLVMIAILWGGGLYLRGQQWTHTTGETLSVALVQPNNPLLLKWNPNTLPNILNNFSSINESLKEKDLIIWPEAAIPRLKHTVQPLLDQQDKFARDSNTALILGIPIAKQESDYYNGVIGLGSASGEYRKQRLVPFGEYVPLEHWLRGLIDFFDLPMSNFKTGPRGQETIHIANRIKIASAICYEIAYPDLVAENAKNTHVLLTLSNDTWFGRSIGPHQHLQMARMRALENAKPLIRATNDGITALIDSKGKIGLSIPQFKSDILKGWVTPRGGETFYTKQGSVPVIILCFFVFFTVALRSFFGKTNKIN